MCHNLALLRATILPMLGRIMLPSDGCLPTVCNLTNRMWRILNTLFPTVCLREDRIYNSGAKNRSCTQGELLSASAYGTEIKEEDWLSDLYGMTPCSCTS